MSGFGHFIVGLNRHLPCRRITIASQIAFPQAILGVLWQGGSFIFSIQMFSTLIRIILLFHFSVSAYFRWFTGTALLHKSGSW